jgi:metallo-beta-lactamase class B
MQFSRITVLILFSLTVMFEVYAQAPVSPPDDTPYRNEAVEPFKIIDNIYMVGTTQHNTSYLITGSAGHIIIDTIYEKDVPQIVKNIEKLGFKPEDIKMIIGTHAHGDHVAGHAAMQEATGAQILSSAADKEVVETGGKSDSVRPDSSWAPAKVDRVIADGEQIKLGDITLTAHLTPGHTKGCMTLTMVAEEGGQRYNVLLLGGVRPAAEPISHNHEYPGMADDLSRTFAKLKTLPADVYLGAHGYWYDLGGKITRMKSGEGYKAFIDPEGYRTAIAGWEQQFKDTLAEEAKGQ